MPIRKWREKTCEIKNCSKSALKIHRGMVLGLLVGAASEEVPAMLKAGLVDHVALTREIEAFAELAVASEAF